MNLSHIVATICLILDGVLIVVLLSGLRRPAVPAAAVPPRARRWLRLVLGVQAVFAIINVAALYPHPSGDGCVAWLHPEARAVAALGGTTPRRPRPLHACLRCRQAESKGGYLHRAITGAYHYERVKVQR